MPEWEVTRSRGRGAGQLGRGRSMSRGMEVGKSQVGRESRKQSRVAEVRGVRTVERRGDSQVTPGLLSHGKGFRPYAEGSGELLKYSKQWSCVVSQHF